MANGAPGDSRVPAWRWRYGRHQRGDPGAAGAGGPVVLDVHLGALARRLRLAGIDAAYANILGLLHGPCHNKH
jgi:hypothetical protein